MVQILHSILDWRARGLVARIAPFMGPGERVLDVGCGTGHNGERLRKMRQVEVEGVDVVDMSVTGPKPQIYDGRRLPYPDDAFDSVVLIYMLHYVDDPASFLKEVKRVSKGRIIIVQTTCRGRLGRGLHWLNEFFLGRFAFHVARATGLVGSIPCSMAPKNDLSPEDITNMGESVALKVQSAKLESYGGFLPIGRFTCAWSKT